MRKADPGLGCWKIWHEFNLHSTGISIGRDHFLEVLYAKGFKIRNTMPSAPRTTDSSHNYPLYPNLVKDLLLTRVNQVWVSDITYIKIWLSDESYAFCYLTVIMDDYNKEIIGYSIHDTLEAEGCVVALEMALANRTGDLSMLIHHSDRGVQYASFRYTQLLKSHFIRISMTETGDPKDNASAERINGTIKNELLYGIRFTDINHAREVMEKKIAFYNKRCPHMSLGMMKPVECRNMTGAMDTKWDRKREKYLKEEE